MKPNQTHIKKLHKTLLTCTLLLVTLLATSPLHAFGENYDIVIIGAGTGGASAAIQAARMGSKVLLVEETGWIGGQLTTAAVSTFDDQRLNRSGIYLEYITKLNEHYQRLGVNNAICYWGADTISGSPRTEQAIFFQMITETPGNNIDLTLHTKAISVDIKDNAVKSITLQKGFSKYKVNCKILIDATECGDIIPLTGARYRAGNSISPNIDPDAMIQDITWVSVMRRYKEIDNHQKLQLQTPPQNYQNMEKNFSAVVVQNGNNWNAGNYPYNIPTFNAYRAIPDPDWNLHIIGDDPTTWGNVTNTAFNWGNDYPGFGKYEPGLSVRYLEDHEYRKQINGQALMRTLGLMWYYQEVLGQKDWAIDTTQGYDSSGDSPYNFAYIDDQTYDEIIKHFPPIPYVRESRRIMGLRTLTAPDIVINPQTLTAYNRFRTSIAVGEYPMDLHGTRLNQYFEQELGENDDLFPDTWYAGCFQVPIECLIPETIDGFLAAEKNISVSRLANGSIRLHPITMLTGQAAGAIASLCTKHDIQPRDIPVELVQLTLLDGKSRLWPRDFVDVRPSSPYWKAVQFSTVNEYIPPFSERFFSLDAFITKEEILGVISPLASFEDLIKLEFYDDFINIFDFYAAIKNIVSIEEVYAHYPEIPFPDLDKDFMTRGEFALAVSVIRHNEAIKAIAHAKQTSRANLWGENTSEELHLLYEEMGQTGLGFTRDFTKLFSDLDIDLGE